MRTILFSWCESGELYEAALEAAGAPPARVVTRPESGHAEEREPAFVARLAAEAPDLIVVAGWGRILRPSLLSVARLGAVNVHPSLLPHYRGKHPSFWALVNGERRVGVTLHRMTDRIDGGPILAQRALDVPSRATAASLSRELDIVGAAMLEDLVREVASSGVLPRGTLPSEPGSVFPPIGPEHGLVDWSHGADAIDRRVRACAGLIEATTSYRGQRLVVLETEPWRTMDRTWPRVTSTGPLQADGLETSRANASPGTVLAVGGGVMVVAAGRGAIALRRCALSGRLWGGEDLARHLAISVGAAFDASPTTPTQERLDP